MQCGAIGLRHPLHRILAFDALIETVYLGGDGARLGACRCKCGLISIPIPAHSIRCVAYALSGKNPNLHLLWGA